MKTLPVKLIESTRISYELRGGKTPVLVLQPGKVGSASIYDGLRKSIVQSEHPTYHLHYISERGISSGERFYLARNTYVRHHFVVSRILRDLYDNNRIKYTLLVSATREPIGRTISSFFENLPQQHPDLVGYSGKELGEKAMARIVDDFEVKASEIAHKVDRWCDQELKDNFDLDVFSRRFDREKGFHALESDTAKLVFFRMEDLSAHFQDGIEWLCGHSIPIGVRNYGNKKEYSEAYGYIKRNMRLPRATVERLLDSKNVSQFYHTEKDAIISKWCR